MPGSDLWCHWRNDSILRKVRFLNWLRYLGLGWERHTLHAQGSTLALCSGTPPALQLGATPNRQDTVPEFKSLSWLQPHARQVSLTRPYFMEAFNLIICLLLKVTAFRAEINIGFQNFCHKASFLNYFSSETYWWEIIVLFKICWIFWNFE